MLQECYLLLQKKKKKKQLAVPGAIASSEKTLIF